MTSNRTTGFHTQTAKTHADRATTQQPHSQPLLLTINFEFATSRDLGERFRGGSDAVYARFGHPTVTAAAKKVADLEGAEAAQLFGSGMAAITTSLLAALKPGDHVVAQRQIFAQTFTFLDTLARSFGVETDFVEVSNLATIEQTIRPKTTIVYVETPSNPLVRLIDLPAAAAIAHGAGALLFVDSTFASPYLQRPIALGADLSLQSGTKYLGGHSDVMCGVAAGSAALIAKIFKTQTLLGRVLDPHAAWLLLRGMKTLGVRVQRASDNALALARFLAGQPGVERVFYPWLEGSPDYELARRQMTGGGGVVSFEVAGGLAGARAVLDALRLIPIATSLGGVETIAEIPWDLDFGEEELGEAAGSTGVTPGLIRLAVGIEDVEDLRDDLEQALAAVRSDGGRRVAAGSA